MLSVRFPIDDRSINLSIIEFKMISSSGLLPVYLDQHIGVSDRQTSLLWTLPRFLISTSMKLLVRLLRHCVLFIET